MKKSEQLSQLLANIIYGSQEIRESQTNLKSGWWIGRQRETEEEEPGRQADKQADTHLEVIFFSYFKLNFNTISSQKIQHLPLSSFSM